jgi:hypothetical protein
MREAIITLATNPEKCAKWGERASELAERNRPVAIAQEYSAVYDQIPDQKLPRQL